MRSVLVLSDDRAEVDLLSATLGRDQRWSVRTGGSPRAGEPAPDVVLVDFEMPGALDAAEAAQRAWPRSALVLRSCRPAAEVGQAARLAGAIGCLPEGLPAACLGEALEQVLALVGLAKTALVKRQLPAHPRSAREARQATRALLHTSGLEQFADDAALLVTELVSNAVRHAHTSVEVAVSLLPGAIRVEVSDSDPGSTVARVAVSEDAEGGRGLAIVQSLANRWGVSTHPAGKTVWFELDGRQVDQAAVAPHATGDGPPAG